MLYWTIKNIKKRWNVHRISYLKKEYLSYNYPLYRAFRKYGIENFEFQIIEICKSNQLDNHEKYWIKFHNSFKNGYNQTLGGGGRMSSNKIKPTTLDKITYDIMYNLSMNYNNIAKKYNVHPDTIKGINKGRFWFRDEIKYPIRTRKQVKEYIRENKIKNYCINCGKEIPLKQKRCLVCYRENISSNHDINREELKMMVRNNSFVKVGKLLSISDNAVRKRCIKLKIPYKRSVINQYTDDEWEKI